MDVTLLEKLKNWRSRRAIRDGVEAFRILSNATLNAIAEAKPEDKEELTAVKGFKDKKFAQYGMEILEIINSVTSDTSNGASNENSSLFESVEASHLRHDRGGSVTGGEKEKVFTVSEFLNLINIALGDFRVKIKGEVSSVDERGNVLYFSLRDKEGGAMVRCIIWQSNYRLLGVKLEEGLEVVLYGEPNVWKPTGGMSFRAETVELVGEGALKKAYDELKRKLEKEGFFTPERKKPIPNFPEKIGLITSKTGAVIHDFLNNIGKFGYNVQFYDSRVEGSLAVGELIRAVRFFRNKDIDVLVVIRGGGSLESMLAFNNEALVREITNFPVPVVVGIGHDKDIPLFALAADVAVSTPTAVTKVLNRSWELANQSLQIFERDIFNSFESRLFRVNESVGHTSDSIYKRFGKIFETFKNLEGDINLALLRIRNSIKSSFDLLLSIEKLMGSKNPERQLKLGYSLAYKNGKLVKDVQALEIGDIIKIKVFKGSINSEVKNLDENDKK